MPNPSSPIIEELDLAPQKVYLTIREYNFGGDTATQVIGVSATPEVAEAVGNSFQHAERATKRSGEAWGRGDTVSMDWEEWDVRGTVPPPAVVRTEVADV